MVKKDEVKLHGYCDHIPTLTRSVVETSLYSDIPNRGGVMIYALMVDEPVFFKSQRKIGPPPSGVEGIGEWILVRRHSWSEDTNGWIWSGHIEIP